MRPVFHVRSRTLLLVLSLVANVALAAAWFLRSSLNPSVSSAGVTAHPSGDRAAAADALRAALASGDLAALRAAGLPVEVARDLLVGRAFARLMAQRTALRGADARWWSNKPAASGAREAELKAQREFSDALLAAWGEDPFFGGSDARLAFLPAAKRAALRRIVQDYDEMLARFGAEGVRLPSDREKEKLLRAERDRDIAALLSPEELAAYQMRTSTTASNLRSRYGDAIASEDEFRTLYDLQKAYDEKFPPLTGRIAPESLRARAEADRQLQDELRAALGEERYTALRRAADSDYRVLEALTNRLNLPPGTSLEAFAARDTYAAESQRINADTSLTSLQRRTQLQALGNRARDELATTLGAEGSEAYAQRSSWLAMLQSGMAFSTTPMSGLPASLAPAGALQSVFPVMPPGGPAEGGARMMINTATSGGPRNEAPGDSFFFAAPADASPQGDARAVATFALPPGEGGAPFGRGPGGANSGQIIVAPPGGDAAAPKK